MYRPDDGGSAWPGEEDHEASCGADPRRDCMFGGSSRGPDSGERGDDGRALAHGRVVRPDDRLVELEQRWHPVERHPGVAWVRGGGRAYSFNGSNSKVTVPNDSSLNPGSQNVTIKAQVKFSTRPSSSVGDYDLVRKQSNTAGTYKMEILQTGRAFCRFSGTNGGTNITAGPDLSDNRWHTITAARRHRASRSQWMALPSTRASTSVRSRAASLSTSGRSHPRRLVQGHHGRGQHHVRIARQLDARVVFHQVDVLVSVGIPGVGSVVREEDALHIAGARFATVDEVDLYDTSSRRVGLERNGLWDPFLGLERGRYEGTSTVTSATLRPVTCLEAASLRRHHPVHLCAAQAACQRR